MSDRAPRIGVEPGEFPFPLLDGPEESRYLTWLRNHSNYMAVRGFLDYVRAFGVLIRGAGANFLIFLPYLIGIAVAVAAYSFAAYRPWMVGGALALAAVYLLWTGRRSIAGWLWPDARAGLRFPLGWRLLRLARLVVAALLVFWIGLGLVAVAAEGEALTGFAVDNGFPLTIIVLVLGVAWSLLFVLGAPLFRARSYERTIRTGSDSSVKSRDAYERSFGFMLLALAAVAGFELLAHLLPRFQRAVTDFGWPAFAGLIALTILLVSIAARLVSALGGTARKVALAAIGGLGVLLPAILVLSIADFLLVSDRLGDPWSIYLVSLLLPGGIVAALVVFWRAFSWRDRAWGVALVAYALVLIFVLASGWVIVEEVNSATRQSLEGVAERLATLPANEIDAVIEAATAGGIGGRLRGDVPEADASTLVEERLWHLDEVERAAAAERLRALAVLRSPEERVRAVLRDSDDYLKLVEHWWCPPLVRLDLVCELVELREMVVLTASFEEGFAEIHASDEAESVRTAAFGVNALSSGMLALLLGFLMWLTVDVNLTSIHGLYRDRLATAFLVGIDSSGDVDIEEDLNLEELGRHEAGSIAPYHLINTALNLQGSTELGVRDRMSDFFIFSKRFIGGERTGYCRSETMERFFPQMDLATAMAISAGAASPNMGRGTSPALVAILTLLNIRMGFWVPNPGRLEARNLPKSERRKRKLAGLPFDDPEAETSVFHEETCEIERRWQNLDPAPNRALAPAGEDRRRRPTVEHGLVGIAYSGGGLRSATLNLGITQALHARGVFDQVDYMSTVSGGGYLGSSISALMRQRSPTASELTGRVSVRESGDLRHSLVRVESAAGEAREYRYSKEARLAVADGDTVFEGQRLIGMAAVEPAQRATYGQFFGWRVRPTALLREIGSKLHERGRWVNVSDGGHIENLATIELLRRRCKFILVGDGEEDAHHHFHGLATLIRSARIDLGVRITIDLHPLRLDNRGRCLSHWAIGRIDYPGETQPGHLLYMKASITGGEDEVIVEYRNSRPKFPHEPTADQSFTEGQFEAYRGLGQQIAESALAHAPRGRLSYQELRPWFQRLWRSAPRSSTGSGSRQDSRTDA